MVLLLVQCANAWFHARSLRLRIGRLSVPRFHDPLVMPALADIEPYWGWGLNTKEKKSKPVLYSWVLFCYPAVWSHYSDGKKAVWRVQSRQWLPWSLLDGTIEVPSWKGLDKASPWESGDGFQVAMPIDVSILSPRVNHVTQVKVARQSQNIPLCMHGTHTEIALSSG